VLAPFRKRAHPKAGLHAAEPLADFQPCYAANADLLARTGRFTAALPAQDRAIVLAGSESDAEFPRRRRIAAHDLHADEKNRP
jgi:predicted RNA polymerase sigma factor